MPQVNQSTLNGRGDPLDQTGSAVVKSGPATHLPILLEVSQRLRHQEYQVTQRVRGILRVIGSAR